MKPKSGAKASTPAATPANLANSNLGRWEQEGGNPSGSGVGDLRHEEHVPQDVPSALSHGKVVIAAITSCTNTSNPSVMIAAGLLAKKAGGDHYRWIGGIRATGDSSNPSVMI